MIHRLGSPEKASLGLAESVYGFRWSVFASALRFIIVFSLQSLIHTCFVSTWPRTFAVFLVCLYLALSALWNSTVT